MPLAYKSFLRAIEQSSSVSAPITPSSNPISTNSSTTDSVSLMNSGGWNTRIWWDLLYVSQALTNSNSSGKEEQREGEGEITVERLEEVLEMAKEMIKQLYDGNILDLWETQFSGSRS